ncbi:MAG: tail fiber domain-containing protein, partial [Bacteroidales bacterium]
ASGIYSIAMGTFTEAIGSGTTAMGSKTIASGTGSTAMGRLTTASGWNSTAMGEYTSATGDNSTVMGYGSTASGDNSFAMGYNSTASGDNSFAMGYNTIASGGSSLALGKGTIASYSYSIAMGGYTKSSGYMSTSIGGLTTASGRYSTAGGYNTTARSCNSFVIGRYNDTLTTSSLTTWVETDPLFIIGNGTADNSRHNTVMVKKNGEVYLTDVYDDVVGSTNRDLFIDNTGKIGYVSSSLRNKKEINTLEDISWIYRLRPVNFVYKKDINEKKQYGLIAEEVEEVNPLLVSYSDDGEVETVLYNKLVTPILKALQKHEKTIEEQQKMIESQEQKINELTDLVNKLLQE